MNKAKTRLAFFITWGLLFASAQLPLILLYTAIGFEKYTIAISEILAAIFTAMMSAIMVVKEDL